MELYEINESYILYLKSFDKKVLDNHFVKHNRKYLGLSLTLNSYIYYLPLSHPDNSDYDANGNVRKTVIPIFRMVTANGKLLGKILLNNMIPVPMNQLTYYDVNTEQDSKYKSLVLRELRIIKTNQKKIITNANILYKQKIGGLDFPYLKATVDFKLLETACSQYKPK